VAVRPTAPSDDQMDQLILEAHDVLGEGVIVGDGSRVIHVNDAACRLYGYRRQELLAMESLFGLFRSDEQDRISGSLAGRSERGEPAPDRFETVIVRKGGEELDVDVSVKAVLSGDRVRTLTIIRDTTDRRRAEAELTRLAFHDPLTGLPNRLLFLDRIERSMARARRTGTRGALLYLDLDGFKAVNDTYGHPVGDLVLMAVAERISEVMREQDSGFRLGGDEFAVLVDSVGDEEHAQIMRQRVFDAIARPVQTAGGRSSPPENCWVGPIRPCSKPSGHEHAVGPRPSTTDLSELTDRQSAWMASRTEVSASGVSSRSGWSCPAWTTTCPSTSCTSSPRNTAAQPGTTSPHRIENDTGPSLLVVRTSRPYLPTPVLGSPVDEAVPPVPRSDPAPTVGAPEGMAA